MKKKYLISGICGQDGQIATKLICDRGHDVAGLTHEKKNENAIFPGCSAIWAWDWNDEKFLTDIFKKYRPDFFLNFAAYHHSSSETLKSFLNNEAMINVNVVGLFKILKVILSSSADTSIVHASSSQIYTARKCNHLVDESSLIAPSTFYGCTKDSGMKMIDFYRREYGLKGGSAIFFNHESEFRTQNFVTRKISNQIAKIKLGLASHLELRNIGAMADFTSAYDSVDAVVKMCEKDVKDDYVISSAKAISIGNLVKYGFDSVELDWEKFTKFEKNETPHYLIGDNSRALQELNWCPAKSMKSVIESMVNFDLNLIRKSSKV